MDGFPVMFLARNSDQCNTQDDGALINPGTLDCVFGLELISETMISVYQNHKFECRKPF